MLCFAFAAHAQKTEANTPVSPPAGAQPTASTTPSPTPTIEVSDRDHREADNAYLQGAHYIQKRDFLNAERSFARATHLDPTNPDYPRALFFARESQITDLLHAAARAKYDKDFPRAKSLLEEAQKLDPDNRIVAQHLANGGEYNSPAFDPLRFPPANIASTLAGAVQLKPTSGKHSFHERGDATSLLRAIYAAWGITTIVDTNSTDNLPTTPIRFDLDDVDFDTATRLAHTMTRSFATALQPDRVIIAKDTPDNRDRLTPLVEETIYVRGMTTEKLQEYANVARNIYDVKNVTASAASGALVLRADEPTLKLVNAAYADLLDGTTDIMLDINLYEVDKSFERNLGVTTPTSASGYSLYTKLESILTEYQSTINAALSSNLIDLSGLSQSQTQLAELYYLYKAGVLSSSETSLISGLLGYLGTYGGVPLLGVSLSSGATINGLLTDSQTRLLDSVTLRAEDNEAAQFRLGERYPIVTSTYSSGVSSSVAALAAQYGYSVTSVTIPQIQYQDLGLSVKVTPKIHRGGEVYLTLEMKLSALGSQTINSLPVLNNREFSSSLTVPANQTALITSAMSRSEAVALSDYPGLNDIPGFSGTNKDSIKDTTELLITVTPHIIRQSHMRVESHPYLTPNPAQGGSNSQ
ncbi:hypothetical protein [Granulicella cerasi]|uniref:hypothetical protein n=1 Tax=Granulicella cerasi TaxID=741063 RepID=UPI0021E023B4|nr:hypothetical protein [Granulicella cerasi]